MTQMVVQLLGDRVIQEEPTCGRESFESLHLGSDNGHNLPSIWRCVRFITKVSEINGLYIHVYCLVK